jgi:hypothetical protein
MATRCASGLGVPTPRASLEIVLLPVDRPGLAELTRTWGRGAGLLAGGAAAAGLTAVRGRVRRTSLRYRRRADGVGSSVAVPAVSPSPDQRTEVVP